MPELPEVEAVRRMLERATRGARIDRVELRRPDLRRPFPPDFVFRLTGHTIQAISRRGKWLVWRPLVFLGLISYPLYLVHVVVGFAVIRWGVAHGWTTIEGVVAAGVVSLVMATLLHYFVEVPGGRWARNALGRRQSPPNRPGERSSPLPRRGVASANKQLSGDRDRGGTWS